MLEAILPSGRYPLCCEDYGITRSQDGRDTLCLELSRRDPACGILTERVRVLETTGAQTYLVASVDAGQKTVAYELQKDLSDWETRVIPGYTNGGGTGSYTAEATLRELLPAGWTLEVSETDTLAADIQLQGPTPLEAAVHCTEVFGCGLVFDTRRKALTLHFPRQKPAGGAFAVEAANLREAPEYKSKAGGLVTRLYAQGAEGMDFASINGGKPYVECFDFTREVIAGFWRDDRYTVPAHLLEAAAQKVEELSRPARSWTLAMADLCAAGARHLSGEPGNGWAGLQVGLFDVMELQDPTLGQRMEVQVMEMTVYPHRPEKNQLRITNRTGLWRPMAALLRALDDSDALQQLRLRVDRLQAGA